MSAAKITRLALASLLVVVVAACSGGGGDPTATVKDMVNLVETKQFSKVADIACAKEKESVAEKFDLGSSMAQGMEGVDAQAITDAMTIKFESPVYKELEKSGDKAKVQLTGTMKVGFDNAKLKAVMKTVLEAQGLPADDATIDAALGSIDTMFGEGQPVDSTVDLVQENGKWVICGVTDAAQ